ncbi:MAG: TolC family protein [Candidatus Eisenbacteria bacterium]|nr:TolC family protein [Candidatus Eisenbacteria bacterium]
MKSPLFACLLLLALGTPARGAVAPAADTLRLTLDDAVTRAVQYGDEARVARAGVNIAEGQVREAFAAALPQVSGTLTYNRKFDSIFRDLGGADDTTGIGSLFASTPFGAVHGWTADVTATQLLWSGGRVGAGLSAAKAVRRASVADRDETIADVRMNARTAYLEAAYAAEVRRIAEEGLEQSRAHLKQVQLFRAQGSRSEYDLLQAQVDAANQEPAVVAARNAAALALLDLRRALNLPLTQPLVLVTPLAFPDGKVPVLAKPAADGLDRDAIASADAMVRARREALRAEKAGRWPQLSASATISHQAYPQDWWPERRQFTRAIDGSVKLEWPLFQGFRTFGTVQRATAELRRAEAQREQVREGVALQVEQAKQEVWRTQATLAARRGTAALARRAHHLATVRWQNGLSTQLEVSDARLQLQTAEVNEASAFKDYRLALLRLERVTGHPLALELTNLDDLSTNLPTDGDR